MLISQIGLLESIQNQDHRIIPGCPGNPYRFIHTKCPLSRRYGLLRLLGVGCVGVRGLVGSADAGVADDLAD